MKKQSIKAHLAEYSIAQKRTTTINHAFASAIATADKFDESKLDAALRILEQDPNSDLRCVYCRLPAETWDHLAGLVENSEWRGYGHQIGNLVPCCRKCNSSKGSKDWKSYLRSIGLAESEFRLRTKLIDSYLEQYAVRVDPKRAMEILPTEWKRYAKIKGEILDLMKEADIIAAQLRDAVKAK